MATASVTAVRAPPASDRRTRLLALAAVLVLAAVAIGYQLGRGAAITDLAASLAVAGSFIGTGFYAWARRPDNRIGPLMALLGAGFLLLLFGGSIPLRPIVLLGFTIQGTLLAYLILAFPSGVLGTTTNRALVAITAILQFVSRAILFVTDDPALRGSDQANPYLLYSNAEFVRAYEPVPYLLDIGLLVVFISIAIVRWVRASGPARRVYTPVAVATVALLSLILLDAVIGLTDASEALINTVADLAVVGRIAFPFAFLLGLMRMRMARSAVADLVVELGDAPAPERLRDALANALGDRSLEVGYWSPEAGAYLDGAGQPVELPVAGSGRAVTLLARGGEPMAAIVHDPAILEDPGLVASVASAMRLAVENERLTAAVEAQLDEVRASRARIVAAGDEERRRVERDLHDGAQQRLVSLTLAIRLAQAKLGSDPDPAVRASLEQASEEAREALKELRELARGIHPQVLTQAGLRAAIQSLADRSPVPVAVEVGDARYSPAVEGTAYFLVSEALANVAKYAAATHASVRAAWADDLLTIEVADDGEGGADPSAGSGLRGLADRLAAIDGTLEVSSPHGGGTTVRARIPAVSPALSGIAL